MWIGAAVAALLLTTGKALLALYLTRLDLASAYRAAASLVIVLTWVYYSAQILLLGAEITHVYAIRHGSRVERATASMQPKAIPRDRPFIQA